MKQERQQTVKDFALALEEKGVLEKGFTYSVLTLDGEDDTHEQYKFYESEFASCDGSPCLQFYAGINVEAVRQLIRENVDETSMQYLKGKFPFLEFVPSSTAVQKTIDTLKPSYDLNKIMDSSYETYLIEDWLQDIITKDADFLL
jgi:hypothetical protein